jgi:HEAT repeat protein
METNKLRTAIDKLRQELGIPTLAALWRAANVEAERWNKLAAPDAPKTEPTREDIEELIQGLSASTSKYRLSTAQEKALYEAIGMNVTLTERDGGGTSLVTPDPEVGDDEGQGLPGGSLSLGAAGTVTNLNSGSGQQFNIGEVRAERDLYQGNTYHQTTYNYYNRTQEKTVPGQNIAEETALARSYLKALIDQFKKQKLELNYVPLRLQPGKAGPRIPPDSLEAEYEQWATLFGSRSGEASFQLEARYAPDPDKPEVNLEAFLDRYKRIALLGQPGAGKSTTLRRLVREYGKSLLSDSSAVTPAEPFSVLPVYVSLNQWRDLQMGLVEFVQEQIESLVGGPGLAQLLPDLMRQGRVLLLLDGLNELPQLARDEAGQITDYRARVIAELSEKAEWQGVRCVLSCRVKEFRGGPNWHDLHVLDLTRAEVEAMAGAYYQQAEIDGDRLVKGLIHELYESGDARKEKLQGLAERPFFVRKLLFYYWHERKLPSNPAKLLDFTVKEALRHEVEDKTGLLNSKAEAEELATRLSYLAFNMTDANRVGGVDKELAAGWLFHIRERRERWSNRADPEPEASPEEQQQAKELLRQGEGLGLLLVVEQDGNYITFSHQLWQEYFSVRHLVSQKLNETLLRLAGQSTSFDEVWRLWSGLDQGLVDRLVTLLHYSEDSQVRSSAAHALGQIGDHQVVESLILAFQSSEYEVVRSSAALALGNIGDPRVIEPLLVALQSDKSSRVRRFVALVLGKTGDQRVVEPLIMALQHDEDSRVREIIAEILGYLEDSRAFEPLLVALKGDRRRQVRSSAALALGKIGNRGGIKPLLMALQSDKDTVVRSNAALALGNIGDRRAVKPLIAALQSDEDRDVRRCAALALGKIGDSQAVEPLIVTLQNDKDSWIRYFAAYALGDLGDSRALPPLEEAASSDEGEGWLGRTVKVAAAGAIARIKARQEG